MTSENIGSSYYNAMESVRWQALPLRLNEQPATTYPELQKVLKAQDYLQAVLGPYTGPLDNEPAPMYNNNTERGLFDLPLISKQYLERPCTQELSISVDLEEESGHSWRPSLANSLSSDFFVPHANLGPSVPSERVDTDGVPPQLPAWELGVKSNTPPSSDPVVERNAEPSHSRHDVQSYVQSQNRELNVLKYEVMNARRAINESRSAIANLIRTHDEFSKFQNSQNVKLRKDNAQLRLECQCLCMEVDFYLKGQAPLGEVDENFYVQSNSAESSKTETPPSVPKSRNADMETQEDPEEEGNKWKCHQCTFDNHPAINCCEMCHIPRLRSGNHHFQCLPQDTCFCHPQSS